MQKEERVLCFAVGLLCVMRNSEVYSEDSHNVEVILANCVLLSLQNNLGLNWIYSTYTRFINSLYRWYILKAMYSMTAAVEEDKLLQIVCPFHC